MSTITRTWLAFAAIGAGLIHFALVVGSPLPLGIVLAIVGLAEFAWGVLTFARESLPLPRFVIVGALLPVLAWGLLLVTSTVLEDPEIAAALPFLPLAIASIFELFIATAVAVRLRRRSSAARVPGVARYLVGLALGGLVVASLTTPALAATPAGQAAQPHGEHTDAPTFILPSHNH
ncbi:MAG: hypothetical protein ABI632_04950 [Pseudolysinimonas sp.]